jgi:transcriptional regulator with XRE-family HTH domain
MSVAQQVPQITTARPLDVRTLRKWRRLRGHSQIALARLAGISVHTVSAIERKARAEAEVPTMRALSRVLGVGITQIAEFAEALCVEADKPTDSASA